MPEFKASCYQNRLLILLDKCIRSCLMVKGACMVGGGGLLCVRGGIHACGRTCVHGGEMCGGTHEYMWESMGGKERCMVKRACMVKQGMHARRIQAVLHPVGMLSCFISKTCM